MCRWKNKYTKEKQKMSELRETYLRGREVINAREQVSPRNGYFVSGPRGM